MTDEAREDPYEESVEDPGFPPGPEIIKVALAAGVSIVVLAWFSKRVLPEPLSYLELALPPFLAAVHGSIVSHPRWKRWGRARWWVVAILATTALVIGANAL